MSEPAVNTQRQIEVTADDLPLHCPTPATKHLVSNTVL